MEIHGNALGQLINFEKSNIMFSQNFVPATYGFIQHELGVKEGLGRGKYRGMHSLIGRSKKSMSNFAKDKIWCKIQSWSGRFLSRVGKEVMIKVVLQAIQTYCTEASL